MIRRQSKCELTANRREAAEIALSLYRSRQLPSDRFDWMIETLMRGEQFEDVIGILEQRLRAGLPLDGEQRRHLERAYNAVGRTRDAQRAFSESSEKPRPPRRASARTIGSGSFSVPTAARRSTSPPPSAP